MKLLFLSGLIVAIAGCASSPYTISDTGGTVEVEVGQTLQFAAGDELKISVLAVDQEKRAAQFRVYDTADTRQETSSLYEGWCLEGELLKISPTLEKGIYKLVRIRDTSVSLSILGYSPRETTIIPTITPGGSR